MPFILSISKKEKAVTARKDAELTISDIYMWKYENTREQKEWIVVEDKGGKHADRKSVV